ncbi:MAG: DUF3048 domain-containing protein [Candidatus Saccharibacteria bacterium]|nr:DUF3048 domain-containing protein [Candidatus Saccharibacteria bacterium]
MSEQKNQIVTAESLREAFEGKQEQQDPSIETENKKTKSNRKFLIINIIGGVSFVIGLACLLFALLGLKSEQMAMNFPKIPSVNVADDDYSLLTGEPVASAALKTAPTYCIQMPNGTDGARPQSGLAEAGVVFEAIAEAGITRFAAIYQDPSVAIIGPIRSLRIYYLEWDTPFDCTIVHAGGSGDALAAVANGYKDLSEDYAYMYRGTHGGRLWNNLFTTSSYLKQYSTDHGYNTSDVKGFARLTPEESDKARVDATATEKLEITKAAAEDTSETSVPVSTVAINLGGWADFNINYNYDEETNTYLRSYASGAAHQVYECADEDLGERNPEDVCSLIQVAPSVVVAMVVEESRAADNYHEDITTIGSGDVYIFQNGTAIKGTWQKGSAGDQIKFTDSEGKEIKLAPGQTFITAVPKYGSVAY